MKMKIIPIVTLAISTLTSISEAAVPFIHYQLDETSGTAATDTGFAGANGVYQGGFIQGVSGQFGTAVDFNGTNGEIFKGGFTALNELTSGFSIGAWIEPDTVAGTQRIFSNVGGGNGWGFGLSGNELIFTTYGIQDFTSSGAGIAADVFTHVAVVFDEDFDAEFFINGSSIGTVLGSSAGNVALGNWFLASTGGDQYLDGTIDEFHIYDTVLSSADIKQLFNDNIVAAPEPSSAILIVFGSTVLLLRGRKSRLLS